MTQPPNALTPPRDPRAVANLLLDLADESGVVIRHIKLQKLLYFAHGTHLMRTGAPLVSGFFEAWKRGPVHPVVYRAFRDAGANPIAFRAAREDILTGVEEVVAASNDVEAKQTVSQILYALGPMRDFDLVELSHAPGGPWDKVVDSMEEGLALGARIDEGMIRSLFNRHKLVLRSAESGQRDERDDRKHGATLGVDKPFSSFDRTRKPVR